MLHLCLQTAARSCGTLQVGLGLVEQQHPSLNVDSQSETMVHLVMVESKRFFLSELLLIGANPVLIACIRIHSQAGRFCHHCCSDLTGVGTPSGAGSFASSAGQYAACPCGG